MSSAALVRWRTIGLARLDELEAVHATLTGSGPGRRSGTRQLNRSLFLALVAQFQSYCRDVHDEAVSAFLAEANPMQRDALQILVVRGRQLDTHSPRRATIGQDFGRLGMWLIPALKQEGIRTRWRLDVLDRTVDYRNAIAHGNERAVEVIESAGAIGATMRSYREHRRAIEILAGTLDRVVAEQLAELLRVRTPW